MASNEHERVLEGHAKLHTLYLEQLSTIPTLTNKLFRMDAKMNNANPRPVETGADLAAIVRENFFRSRFAACGVNFEYALDQSQLFQFGIGAIDFLLHLIGEQSLDGVNTTFESSCDELVRIAGRGELFDGRCIGPVIDGERQLSWIFGEGLEPVSLAAICMAAQTERPYERLVEA